MALDFEYINDDDFTFQDSDEFFWGFHYSIKNFTAEARVFNFIAKPNIRFYS